MSTWIISHRIFFILIVYKWDIHLLFHVLSTRADFEYIDLYSLYSHSHTMLPMIISFIRRLCRGTAIAVASKTFGPNPIKKGVLYTAIHLSPYSIVLSVTTPNIAKHLPFPPQTHCEDIVPPCFTQPVPDSYPTPTRFLLRAGLLINLRREKGTITKLFSTVIVYFSHQGKVPWKGINSKYFPGRDLPWKGLFHVRERKLIYGLISGVKFTQKGIISRNFSQAGLLYIYTQEIVRKN